MASEKLCLEIVGMIRGRKATCTTTFGKTAGQEDHADDSISEGGLIRPLLARYELRDIEAAVRWLQLGGFLGKTEWGLGGLWVHTLTERGCTVADAGRFPDKDRKLFYRADPHAVFIAHQFTEEDEELVGYLQREVLVPSGFAALDGRAEGLEEFRHSILAKIKRARFFICLLTCRVALESGSYVSSVWLYQEIGAAMAFGRKPLLLVEEGMDPQYVGELQRTYEHIPFTRSNHARVFQSVVSRLRADLEAALIPLPPVPRPS